MSCNVIECHGEKCYIGIVAKPLKQKPPSLVGDKTSTDGNSCEANAGSSCGYITGTKWNEPP